MHVSHLAPELVAFAPLVALLAAFVSGVTGMAGGMLMMAALVLLLPVPEAMVLHGITQLTSNACRLGFHSRHVHWTGVKWHMLGAAIIVVALSFFRFIPSKPMVLCLLGALPFLAAATPRQVALDFAKPLHALFCGLTSSLTTMTVGVAGGVMDLFFLRGSLDRYSVMGTKSATQIFIQFAKIGYFYLLSNPSQHGVGIYALIPTVAISTFTGIWLGKVVLTKMSERRFRLVGTFVLFATGAVLVVKGLLLTV